MASEGSLDYRLLVHLLRHCYTKVVYTWTPNRPDPTTQLLLNPSATGYSESVIRRRGSMLTPTYSQSFNDIPRLLDAIAAVCVDSVHRDSYATGLQVGHSPHLAIITISTNMPCETHPKLEAYVTEIWNTLQKIASHSCEQDPSYQDLLCQLRNVVFNRMLPRIRYQLKIFGPPFRTWVSSFEDIVQGMKSEFGEKLFRLCREVIKAMDLVCSKDKNCSSEIQEVVMIMVPQIMEEIRKIKGYSSAWRSVALEVAKFNPEFGEFSIYNHIARIAAFSTHANAMISTTRTEHRRLFTSYKFKLDVIPSVPSLPYSSPSPPADQEAAKALVAKIRERGDPEGYWFIYDQFLRFHVELAPKDDQSKVVVHSEIGLLVHYLKHIGAAMRGKCKIIPPINYFGTSMLQCAFCQTLFRVLGESVLPHTVEVEVPLGEEGHGNEIGKKRIGLRFLTRGADRRFPRNWSWPKDLVNVVQEILVHQNRPMASDPPPNSQAQAQAQASNLVAAANSESAPAVQAGRAPKVDWATPIPARTITNPDSTTEVEEAVMGSFTTKLCQLLCEGWALVEDEHLPGSWFDSLANPNIEFKLPGSNSKSGLRKR